jgi:hypothetical protein
MRGVECRDSGCDGFRVWVRDPVNTGRPPPPLESPDCSFAIPHIISNHWQCGLNRLVGLCEAQRPEPNASLRQLRPRKMFAWILLSGWSYIAVPDNSGLGDFPPADDLD